MSTSANTNPCIEGKIETTQSKITNSGFKPSEYGLVPNDWDVCKLGEIAHIYSGGTPNRKVPEYWDGQIPWVTTTLIDGVTIDNALEFISEKGVEFSSTRWCKAGTLLMAMYGQGKTRGKVGMLGFDATINQACAAIDLKDKESSKYLFHVLNSMYDKIRESSNSGGQENLSGSIIKGLSVPLPPKEEQTAIANALSDVDALIQELEKLIAKKQAIKTATMQQLLTGRTRLPQFAHHPDGRKKGYKPSELAEIPEDWEVCDLGFAAKVQGGFAFKSDKFSTQGVAIVRIGNIQSGLIDTTDLVYYPHGEQVPKQFEVFRGDALIAMSGATTGKVGIYDSYNKAYTNQRVGKFVAASNNVSMGFIHQLVGSELYKNLLESQLEQGAQPNVSSHQLESIQIRLPSDKTEQEQIALMLTEMDQDLQGLGRRLSKTRHIKQGMMQELLTGKTRLKL